MSTVLRLCIHCQIRIFHGIRPHILFTSWHNSLRYLSSTQTGNPDAITSALNSNDDPKQGTVENTEYNTLLAKNKTRNFAWQRRRGTSVTTTEVERFLERMRRRPVEESNEPGTRDAQKVDRQYDELIMATGFGPFPAEDLKVRRGISVDKSYQYEDIKVSTVPAVKLPIPSELESKYNYPRATHFVESIETSMGGQKVILHGFIKSLRKINQKVFFLDLYDYRSGPECAVQLISSIDAESTDKQKATHNSISKLPPFVPVAVTGTVVDSISPPLPNTNSQVVKEAWAKKSPKHRPEIRIESLVQLNTVSPNLIYTPETAFPPEKRHLQLRTMKQLSKALRMRAKVSALCRQKLRHLGFLEVETPLLFKSTPEGAREFLVPTRNSGNGGGMCYALPQSPQQYKQILMASGVDRYFQFARCFRDEDLRADRQPEFTQLDLEMSFSRGEDVMHIIEGLLKDLWFRVLGLNFFEPFKRMTYNEAMKSYGTDKPDMRFKHLKIHWIHYRNEDDVYESVEAFKLPQDNDSPQAMESMDALHNQFLTEFQGEGETRFISYIANEKSANGVPEHGLTPHAIEELNDLLEVAPGNIVVIKKRNTNSFFGGSTKLGLLRTALINKAITSGNLAKHSGFSFVWITDFPLFTPISENEPGQSGTAGLASTHHPFTAPHQDDFGLLATSPSRVRAEHYDIVANGVELGGGSRRIHDPDLQRYILNEVIKVHPSKLRQFDHLLDVLGSGCPPHAGIALGFDRLIAVMMGTDSVRDVIAFPKNSKGVDPMVGSPSRVNDEELGRYWLKRV